MSSTTKPEPYKILGVEIDDLTDFKQIEALLLKLNTRPSSELADMDWTECQNNHLFLAMACVASGESSHSLGNSFDDICAVILDLELERSTLRTVNEITDYILRMNNLYIDITTPSSACDFKFSSYPRNILGIDYKNTTRNDSAKTSFINKYQHRLELNQIDGLLHVNTYTWLLSLDKDSNYVKTIKTFKNIQYHTNYQSDIHLNFPIPHINLTMLGELHEMFTSAGLDIRAEALIWLHNWTVESINSYEDARNDYRPDSELEALCALLDLDYKKVHSKFYNLRSIGFLNSDNIEEFTKSLYIPEYNTSAETFDLPYIN